MSGIFKLLRPLNCIMGIIGVLLGAMVGVGLEIFNAEYSFEIIIGMIIAFFFMAAGNMLNDYFDAEQDKINHPDRPIPAGIISPTQVIISAGVIFIILLLLGVLINIHMFFILVLATFLMLSYELLFKRYGLVGNFTIGLLVGMLFLFGAAVVMEFGVVVFLFILALLATLTREIVKDIEDIKGDIDRITLPKVVGIKNASIVAAFAIILAIIISPIPTFPELLPIFEFESLSIYYLYLIIPADILFIIAILNFSKKPKIASLTLKSGMAIALFAFMLGSILI